MHVDNLFFLILVAVAALLRWTVQRAQSSKSAGDESKPTAVSRPAPPVSRETETDEERVRRFMEALGQPRDASPPEKIKPRPRVVPRRPLSPIPPIDPFPRTRIDPIFRRPLIDTTPIPEAVASPPIPAAQQEPAVPRKSFAPPAPRSGFEVESEEEERAGWAMPNLPVIREQSRAVAKETTLAALLRSSTGLRQAILLREIFGRPRSLQPLDPLANS